MVDGRALFFKGAEDEHGNKISEGQVRPDHWVVIEIVARAEVRGFADSRTACVGNLFVSSRIALVQRRVHAMTRTPFGWPDRTYGPDHRAIRAIAYDRSGG
ncbi:hypothetical protein [Streptomyces sp. NPDC052036]|uniref:hypothetical protein n=1 Tax=unclassified Streptomyces TaxID=2593676 RepID=UPI00343B76DF